MEVCVCYFVIRWGIYSYSDITGGFDFNGDGLHGAGYRFGVFSTGILLCVAMRTPLPCVFPSWEGEGGE